MNRGTVRLSDLSRITGRTPEGIRSLQKREWTPWDEDIFSEATQRRYDSTHALGLVLQEMLAAQGLTAEFAAEVLRGDAHNLSRFFGEVEAGQAMTPRFVAVLSVALQDDFGVFWRPTLLAGMGTRDELANAFRAALDATGRTREAPKGTERQIGGPNVAVASINEAYRLLKSRAEAAGFAIDGRRILRLATDAQPEAEA